MLSFPVTNTETPMPAEQREEILENPGFGVHFTDHMASATWTADKGWYDDKVGPLEPFVLHPSSVVFHYAPEIFEGLKAYRRDDGSVWLFRPERNAARFAKSAARLALPELPADAFIASLQSLVSTDRAWVPPASGEQSLYLRPFMVATEAFLGVRPANEVAYRVIASPAGPYFADGVAGVKLWITSQFTRAARGGTGEAKCGGNYAASLLAQVEAREHGCDQVLYLDGAEHKWLEESGTMNLCLITADGDLLTPGLGTILEGVTRDSILQLAAQHGLTPVERQISVTELLEGAREGLITEVFACGTAAVITPIARFLSDTDDVLVNDGVPGQKTLALRANLLDIQYGRVPDPYGWCRQVC